MRKLKEINCIDVITILLTILMFVVGKICTESYKGTAENFVLLDFWNMGMYGNMKYLLYDAVIITFILKYRPNLIFVYALYTLFSIKDFVQFFIDGNIESLPESYVMFFMGLVFLSLFHIIKRNVMNVTKHDGGTEQPHPPTKPKT